MRESERPQARDAVWQVNPSQPVWDLGLAGLGLAGALGLARLIESFLFGVSPHDPATLGTVAVLLLLVTLVAGYVPARRASRVDPMSALRVE